jgi:hypothetical protein
MRAPSNADAKHAEDAGEFPETPIQARSSAEGCAQREAHREASRVSEQERQPSAKRVALANKGASPARSEPR